MTKSNPAAQTTEEEIDQIMGELEKLKGEMKAEDRPNLKVVSDNEDPEASLEANMSDFHAGSDHAPMEDHIDPISEEHDEHPDAGLLDPAMGKQELHGEHDEVPQEEDFEDFESFDNMDNDEEDPVSQSDGDGTLSMTLNGNMNLKLKYEMGGREVTVGFQGNYLKIQLSDGTEFKVPVKK